MLSEEQKSQIKMSMNDKWHLVKLTHVWPDGHLINQMAHALIERNAELLSLREQLAELKALPPFAWGLADKDGNAYLSECCIGDEGCMIDEAEGYNYELEPEHHIYAVPLFTAAKPAGLDVEDITEFMRKAFWRGFESARCTENSNIPADWKDSKPNLLLALNAKMSGA
ncbi:hypothetical protein N4221_07955 [Yersinia enterocolitica]|uniref:hypothetical protein n=1 Tax=Yersinia enterocolitica TaxID=630 RepID=UPI0021E83D23|nr:hypothetical protein [Yersinia enterocolitica]UYK03346.1 hypothetical protein N4221_07955 [Yersinia enterocolitica]